MLIGVAKKAMDGAGPLAGAWGSVMEKLQAGGSPSGAKASATAEQMLEQMRGAVRDSRTAGLRAAATMAEGYASLVSGVLIGMSEALQQGGKPRGKK
jgi:flagellar hook-basal body complex protein FliE